MDKHHPGWAGQPPATQPVPDSTGQGGTGTTTPASQQATSAPGSSTAPTMSAGGNGPARVVAATQNAAPGEAVSLGSSKFQDEQFALDLTLEPRGRRASGRWC